eukprot:CAMPEP_0118955564 /NCGR_PEP_ID=MMETSP1169-20130426/60177_1 /TAXON_ID=36882 /ORGANISM="Pyramimonas obovata, Strain CCMP722" /LENGTH=145 /DNA_ID=CAMNT_0006903439 /DNA_START=39 /DNA_END=476 /DNA_ORIENTATION=-
MASDTLMRRVPNNTETEQERATASSSTTRDEPDTTSAADALAVEFGNLVDSANIKDMRKLQDSILLNLKQSRAMLKDFNDFSQENHGDFEHDVNKHTQIVKTIKQDLDYVFRHTRQLRERIRRAHPEAFNNIAEHLPDSEDDDSV